MHLPLLDTIQQWEVHFFLTKYRIGEKLHGVKYLEGEKFYRSIADERNVVLSI